MIERTDSEVTFQDFLQFFHILIAFNTFCFASRIYINFSKTIFSTLELPVQLVSFRSWWHACFSGFGSNLLSRTRPMFFTVPSECSDSPVTVIHSMNSCVCAVEGQSGLSCSFLHYDKNYCSFLCAIMYYVFMTHSSLLFGKISPED